MARLWSRLRRGGREPRWDISWCFGHGRSSLLFALLHVGNIFSGMSVLTVAYIVVFTFGFGVLRYLSLRVIGNLLWPVLLHPITDPLTFLFTGGIDEQTAESSGDLLTRLAQAGNIVIVIAGIALVWFVQAA